MNIFSNLIPTRGKFFTDNDPPWMTDNIKNKMKLKNKFQRQYIRHQRQISNLLKNKDLYSEINSLITESKEKYYQTINAKLNDPSIFVDKLFNGEKVPMKLFDFQEIENVFNLFFFFFCNTMLADSKAVVSCLQK